MEKKCHICGENDTFTCNQCGKIVCSTHEYNGVCHICYEEEVEMLEDERELEEGYEDCPICEGNNGVYQGDVPNERGIESEYYCTNCERMFTKIEEYGREVKEDV